MSIMTMFHKEFLALSQCTTQLLAMHGYVCPLPNWLLLLCPSTHTIHLLISSFRLVANPTGFSFEMLLKHTPLPLPHLSTFYSSFHILTGSSHSSQSSHIYSFLSSKLSYLLCQTQSVFAQFPKCSLIFSYLPYPILFFYCS